MRYIEIKDDIQIVLNGQTLKEPNGSESPPWTFARYLENIVLADPSIGTGYKALKSCVTLGEQFRKEEPGSYVPIDETDWEMLKNTVENPQGGGIPAIILRQLIPFMDAIIEATNTKPSSD